MTLAAEFPFLDDFALHPMAMMAIVEFAEIVVERHREDSISTTTIRKPSDWIGLMAGHGKLDIDLWERIKVAPPLWLLALSSSVALAAGGAFCCDRNRLVGAAS